MALRRSPRRHTNDISGASAANSACEARGILGFDGLLDRRLHWREPLTDFRTEPLEPIARELTPEVAWGPPELRAKAAREDFGRGEAAGESDVLDRTVAVEKQVAGRLQPDLEVVTHRRVVEPPADETLELTHREAIHGGKLPR